MTGKSQTVYHLFSPAPRQQLRFEGEKSISLTKQAFHAECDINAIIARARRTGFQPPFKTGGIYGDFSAFTDYRDSLHLIEQAQADFMALPATVRDRFQNDPTNLLLFIADANNRQEAIDLGIIDAKVTVPEGQVITETLKTEPPKK